MSEAEAKPLTFEALCEHTLGVLENRSDDLAEMREDDADQYVAEIISGEVPREPEPLMQLFASDPEMGEDSLAVERPKNVWDAMRIVVQERLYSEMYGVFTFDCLREEDEELEGAPG